MKKLFAIFFLAAFLLSTTELAQLLKIGLLVEHYSEHKANNPAMSFVDFLVLHYSNHHLDDHPRNEDYEKDQKLPFMTHMDVMSLNATPVQPIFFELKARTIRLESPRKLAIDDRFTENDILSSIWQPPRFS